MDTPDIHEGTPQLTYAATVTIEGIPKWNSSVNPKLPQIHPLDTPENLQRYSRDASEIHQGTPKLA